MDKETKLSAKETSLYNYIKSETINQKRDVTVKSIERSLGKEYLGAIGKLIQYELIYSEKKRLEVDTVDSRYGYKYTKCYFIKEKSNEKE